MIVGIDFGTSKSVVAVMQNGVSTIVPDQEGRLTMPSVVMVDPDDNISVGWEACQHPRRYEGEHITISSIKRLMGKAGETSWARFRTYPQEVSALILGNLKIQAEAFCGSKIKSAVLAVPAHFDINQRWATLQAAEIAGLDVWRLINEATATVLGFAKIHSKRDGCVLVFDFGAGTLDVSIVSYGDGVCEVLATAGDDRLGGDDFDQVVHNYLTNHINKTCKSDDLDPMRRHILKAEAEKIKIELSNSSRARLFFPGFLSAGGRHFDLDVTVERSAFESMCQSLHDRAVKLVERAIQDAKKPKLTDLILIGGTAHIPYIRHRIAQITGLSPAPHIDPAIAVALGAGIQAGLLAGQIKDDIVLLDVVPRTYSVAVAGDVASPLIPRNCTIPTRGSHVFTTTENSQAELTVSVFEGEKPLASQNTLVGSVRLTGLPPEPAGVPQIEVTFGVDVSNDLTVTAKDLATGREVQAKMEAPHRLNHAQISVLSRKVKKELARVQQRTVFLREQRIEQEARTQARVLAEKIDRFAVTHAINLRSDQKSLLITGVGLIHDYVDRRVPVESLERMRASVQSGYEEVVVELAERHLRLIAGLPSVARWASGLLSSWKTSDNIEASPEAMAVDMILRLLMDGEAVTSEVLWRKLLRRIGDSPQTVFCLAVILSRCASVQIPLTDLSSCTSIDPELFRILRVSELATRHSPAVRRQAAKEILEVFGGTECLFLLDRYAAEKDGEVALLLETCLQRMPGGALAEHFLTCDAAKGEGPWTHPFIVDATRRQLFQQLSLDHSPRRLKLLKGLEKIGVGRCIDELLRVLSAEHDTELRITVVGLLASTKSGEVIAPLFRVSLLNETEVQKAAIVALDRLREEMAPDVMEFFDLVKKVVERRQSLNLREKLFLRRFAGKRANFREIVQALRIVSKSKQASPRERSPVLDE